MIAVYDPTTKIVICVAEHVVTNDRKIVADGHECWDCVAVECPPYVAVNKFRYVDETFVPMSYEEFCNIVNPPIVIEAVE